MSYITPQSKTSIEINNRIAAVNHDEQTADIKALLDKVDLEPSPDLTYTGNPAGPTDVPVPVNKAGNFSLWFDALIQPIMNLISKQSKATGILDSSGKTQQQINDAVLGVTYYAALEGFVPDDISKATANSLAWVNLQNKMVNGDSVVFDLGTFYFNDPINITKIINIEGREKQHTLFKFNNPTNGIIRNVRGGRLSNFTVTGTKTAVTLDPKNKIFGTIGLYDKYDEAASAAGYIDTYNVVSTGFDCGRVNATEGSSTWNGAYRETRDCWFRNNRIGLVFLNGSTDDKYYGGIVSANTEIGIWSYSTTAMYNNCKFIGTTIEGNGIYDQSLGYNSSTPSKCNIYVGGVASVYLIGSYNEKALNFIEEGGQLYKIGCHNHSNAIDLTKNGYVFYSGINWGKLTLVPYFNTLGSILYPFTGITNPAVQSTTAKTVKFRSTVNNGVGYAVRSRLITLPSGILADSIGGEYFRLKYKINSGYTANAGLKPVVEIYFYAKDGSYMGLRTGIWSNYQTQSGNGQVADISAIAPSSVSTTAGAWSINKGQELSHILVSIAFKKGDNSNPDFSSDNLDIDIFDMSVGFFAKNEYNLTPFRHDTGTTEQRPLLQSTDINYRYLDTTLNRTVIWNGTAWVNEFIQADLTAGLTAGTSTTANLSAIANAINTTGKRTGLTVLNTTNNKFYMAVGGAAGDNWISTDGSSTLTPV